MSRYKCEKKIIFLRKKFFRGSWLTLSKRKISSLPTENFFTWIHLAITRCCLIHLKGLKSVPDRGFWAQVYPGSLQMYLFAKKKFHGGMVNPVITQPARMSSCLVPSLHFRCPTLYLGFKLLACNPIFLMWPS